MTDVNFPAPDVTPEQASALLARHYGLGATAQPLEGERDRNFHVTAADGSYVFKVVNGSEPLAESEFQAQILLHLARVAPELAVPRLIADQNGQPLAHSDAGNALRLVSWLPGQPLALAADRRAALAGLGRFLGQLDRALQGFIHPGALRVFDWDIRQTPLAQDRLDHIQSPEDRALVAQFLDHFADHVAPKLAGLRAQVIHNDTNDWNVLTQAGEPAEIAGIIDFGDAQHAPLIAEVAVACAYAIMGSDDPISDAVTLTAAFHAEYPLLEAELDLLFDLIMARLVISVSMSAMRSDQVGDNPYLAVSEAPAWTLLRRMAAMNRRFATAILRHGCGFDATPGAKAVIAWLHENRRAFAPIVRPHPAMMTKALVPYGDPSHPMTVTSANQQPNEASAWWDDYCAEHGITLGIGPWGEARTVYSGDMFKSRFIPGVRRIHHLGLDLFMPAGTALYTPLAGRVRTVEIEHDPLGYGGLVAIDHSPEGAPPFVTLWGHMAHEVLHRLKPGDLLAAGDLVGHMGANTENGGWSPHLHFQISTDVSLSATQMLGVGEARFLPVWAELFPDAADLAQIPPESFASSGRTRAQIVAGRKDILLPNLSISYADPIKFQRGEGAYLIDDQGRAYLDCFNNVCHLGHAHPRVVEALARQAGILNTNTRYLHDLILTYAERLTATLPEGLSVASFACSGSEANSLALRMARTATGRDNAVVLDWAYHGTTQELIDLSPYKYQRKGGKGRPAHVYQADVPDSYRAPMGLSGAALTDHYAQSVAAQIAQMQRDGRDPAFFIAESIPSVAGQLFFPEGYLAQVYAQIRAAGGVCIADEVQVGFGRVGAHWWAFEEQGVVPDIVTMGKPIGNGHPMSAVVTTREMADRFNNGMEYFNTFGGNPVSCAVGLAVLDVIEGDGLRANAKTIGDYLLTRFRALQDRHPVIGDVRGMGLFLGLDLVTDRKTKAPATEFARRVNNEARLRGVLMGTEGPYDNVLKLRPPMIFTRADADLLVEVLEDSLKAAEAALPNLA